MNYTYILFIIIIILFYKMFNFSKCKNIENFANYKNLDDIIAVNYKMDFLSMRELSNISQKLMNKGLTIPSSVNILNNINSIPKGTIIAYYYLTVPMGWVLCDGQNGTPDLRGRFVRMWNDNEKNFNQTNNNETNFRGLSKLDSSCKLLKHNINTVGGTDLYKITDTKFIPKHNHTVSTIPAHNHDFFIQLYNGSFNDDGGSGKPYVRGGAGRNQTDYISFTKEKNHTHTVSSVGSSEPKYITNQPPYFTLTYIMKT